MKFKTLCVAVVATAISTPALALGIEDLAKVILGGNSTLKKAEQTCGTNGQLTFTENATLSAAMDAVRNSLAPQRYTVLDNVAKADADTQAQSGTFCPETKKKKKGLLAKIGKAGRNILLGGLGL